MNKFLICLLPLILIMFISSCQIPTLFVGSRVQGYQDGLAENTKFGNPLKMTIDKEGNLFVADTINSRIRKVTPDGKVTTFAGTGEKKYQDGDLKTASFEYLSDLKFDSKENLFIADNDRIRKITPDGKVTTFADIKEDVDLGIINSIFIDKNDNIYLIYGKTYLKIVSPKGEIKTYDLDSRMGETNTYNSSYQVLVDKDESIYLMLVHSQEIDSIDIYKISKNENAERFPKLSYAGGPMTTDEDGNIYVLDVYQKSIFKISQNGNEVKEIAKLEIWFPIFFSSLIKGLNNFMVKDYSNSMVLDNKRKILYISDGYSIYKIKL